LRKLAAQKMAHENPGQTLQATALVHEAYLRLVGSENNQRWDGRGHFFAAAAEAMRRILVEAARRKGRIKRGGALRRIDLESADLVTSAVPDDLLDLDDALARLSAEEPEAAQLIKLRLFAGLSIDEAAKVLGVPRSTAYDHWAYARAWLHSALHGPQDQPDS
jgi:RNA polymerase sigma factor (TIGR02999 family)